jgi:hypothetical protein
LFEPFERIDQLEEALSIREVTNQLRGQEICKAIRVISGLEHAERLAVWQTELSLEFASKRTHALDCGKCGWCHVREKLFHPSLRSSACHVDGEQPDTPEPLQTNLQPLASLELDLGNAGKRSNLMHELITTTSIGIDNHDEGSLLLARELHRTEGFCSPDGEGDSIPREQHRTLQDQERIT